MRIAVSGLGIVSALGLGLEQQLTALRLGRSGLVSSPHYLSTVLKVPVGEVPYSNTELAARLGVRDFLSRTALLGMVAVSEALADAGHSSTQRTGLVSATSVGGMDRTECFYPEYLKTPNGGRLRDVVMHDCAASTRAMARYCHINGFTTTLSTACSSAANAILFGAKLLQHRVVDRIVVGGTDALSRFTLDGFHSLMILDNQPCRPFDRTRAGLNLGEGAGYLVLEREESLKHAPYGYLAGAANANDAYHQTATSPSGEGAYRAMAGALAQAGISPEHVDYLNVHGTGTPNNDLSEGEAMRRLFGTHIPPFSSTKAFTGHTLAAAGGIEAVLAVAALHGGMIYPSLNFAQPMEELPLRPVTGYRTAQPLRHVLSNSFGFGGNCVSLLFTKN